MCGPPLEVCGRIPDDIGGGARPPKRLVDARPVQAPGGIIRKHYAEIQIAVRPGIAARLRPEQIDSQGMVVLEQPDG